MPVIASVASREQLIALTFDDGPLIPTTAEILDTLAKRRARATFFVRGSALDPSTEYLVVRAQSEGHEIGNHTEHHLPLDAEELLAAQSTSVLRELALTHHKLGALLGAPPLLARAPYGRGEAALDAAAVGLGYRATVHWSIKADDWDAPGSGEIVRRVLGDESVLRGAIVLLHDGCSPRRAGESRAQTAEAVGELVPRLQDLGYTLVTVSELLESAA